MLDGVPLAWVSEQPWQEEWVYTPLTFLQPILKQTIQFKTQHVILLFLFLFLFLLLLFLLFLLLRLAPYTTRKSRILHPKPETLNP